MPKCHLLAIGTHSYLLVTACCATTVLRLIKICIMGSPSRRNSDSRKSAIFFRARRISITVFAHHTLARLHGALQGLRIRNSDLADGDSIKFHTCGSSALPILLRYSRWLTSTPRETGSCCVIKSSPNLSSLPPLSTLHTSPPFLAFRSRLIFAESDRLAEMVYTGRSDVTESMVTIRSPFCGHTTIQCVQLNGEDLSCCSNKTESVSLRRCPPDRWLT